MKRTSVLLVAAPWLLAACSCQRDPARTPSADAPPPAIAADTAAAASPSAQALTPEALAERERARRAATALRDAASAVHGYLAALPNADRTAADAAWTGGRPSPRPDDANLRALTGLISLRVQNAAPLALDREQPPRAVEVPVTLLARTDRGTRRFTGWYRLRARVDGRGWEITSAALQPVLD